VEVEKAFKSVCRVLFGREIGDLSNFEPYLLEMMFPYRTVKSAVSGKDVMVSLSLYPHDAKFISQDEIEKAKFAPLNINEIKDVDSLFEAVYEREIYCGNRLFGKNSNVQKVDNCVDCVDVHFGHNVFNVKYGAYLSYLRESENVFGVSAFPGSNIAMRCCDGVGLNRCFECYYSTKLADTYYAFNCIGCANCMFAFGLRGKRYLIGNLQLEKGKYLELREKLVAEMAEELAKNKRLFSIVDLAENEKERGNREEEIIMPDAPVPARVEEAFENASNVVLGKKLAPLKKYGEWLLHNALKTKKVKGAFGKPVYKVVGLPIIERVPARRLVGLSEIGKAAESKIALGEGEKPGLREITERVSKIALFCEEFVDGQNEKCVDTMSIFTGAHTYKLWDVTNSSYAAYSSGVINSQYVFGGYLRILNSEFCINCYDSTNLKRCFEVDGSYSTRDSYLCHDCENISDCILCFNSKNLKYAVGNTEVGKDEYSRVKKMLLDGITGELEKNGKTDIGIFSLLGKKRKNTRR
jgi:hypothetical protein